MPRFDILQAVFRHPSLEQTAAVKAGPRIAARAFFPSFLAKISVNPLGRP